MKFSRRAFNTGLVTLGGAAAWATISKAETPDGIELVARPHQMSLVGSDGPPSDLWGYNGGTPGPELRFAKDEEVLVKFRNELPEPTSIHWHGIRIDNAMDGVAGLTQAAVEPGESFTYRFQVPDAGTYWYHAHNRSWNQVARGLYGPLIVDEPNAADRWQTDLTLIVDDWRVDRNGVFDAGSLGQMMDWSHSGRLGNVITVNGLARPSYDVPAGRWVRLRLVNASNARVMEFDPARFGGEIIAYDGQSLGHRKKLSYAPMLLGPAQRVDMLARFDDEGEGWLEELSGEPFPFARLNVVRSSTVVSENLPALVVSDLPEPQLSGAHQVDLVMEGGAMGRMGDLIYNGIVLDQQDFMLNKQVWGFNGVANLAETPLFSAERGRTVVVNIVNKTRFEHAMHVHGHHFRILARGGQNPEADAWRDTVMVFPDETVKIALVCDNPGKWLLHCHMLEHAAAGMNTWFQVG